MSTRLFLLAPALLLAACSSPGSAPNGAPATTSSSAAPSREDAALAGAKAAAQKLGAQVRTRLVDAMNAGGAAHAVQVCAAEAQTIAAQVAKDTGATVGRSSLKLRNPGDAGPAWVQTWLTENADKKADLTRGIEGIFDSPTGRVARFLKPIPIEGTCLSCHGDPATLAAPVKTALAAKYPEDKATGYQNGDLRGALWAEVPVN